jgi:hypothetical protein
MDCLETDSDASIVKKELYNVFTEYCRFYSLPTVTQDTFFKNLPRHIPIADHRPKIKGQRYYTFKGLRYKLAVSNLSMVSRVFYTLREKKDDYGEGFHIEEFPGENYIKIGLALDRIDTLDTHENQLESSNNQQVELKFFTS